MLARCLAFPRLSILACDALAYRGDCTLLAVLKLSGMFLSYVIVAFSMATAGSLIFTPLDEKMGIIPICLHHFIMIHGLHLK